MKSRLTIFSFVLLLFFLNSLPAFSQQVIFNKVLPPDGKPFEHVTGITQDVNGYMWLASKKGLFSYDGYNMIAYKNDPLDPNSIVSDNLEAICADTSGIIWIGTSNAGLLRFDPTTGIFKQFLHNPQDPASINSDFVSVVFADHGGFLWVGTSNGLDRYNAQTGKFIHYSKQQGDSTSISSNAVVAIYEDKQGTLWIGTGSVYGGVKADKGGLYRMNKKTETFTRYLHDPNNPQTLINNKVRSIFEDSKGTFWIGTAGDGLHTMDRANGTFKRHLYDPAHPERLSRPPLNKEFPKYDHITFIKEDANGAIWIGTTESGLNHYDPKTERTTHYESNKDTAGSFTDRTTWWAYTSRDGIVWVSTLFGNVYRIVPFHKKIPHNISRNFVNCFYEEPKGILWTGTQKELIRNDIKKGIVKRYVIDPAGNDNVVQTITEDRQGNIWVGGGGGLNLWNKERENFINYKNNPKNKNSLSCDNISIIHEDQESNLWIGTYRGFNFLNRKTNSFTRYFIKPKDTTEWGENTISAILRDKKRKLWIGTWLGGGVYLFNTENSKFKNYLTGITVSCLLEDADGALWLGSDDGLYKFDRNIDAFIRYKVSSSLTDISFVNSMVEDNQKYLWLQTQDGLVSLNPQRNETRIYGKNFGVGKNLFGFTTCYKVKPPEIFFISFRLTGQLVKPGNKGPLKENLSQATEIRLRYNQNVFSFDFAAIDYANPEDNRHFFMLENYDDSWRPAGSALIAHYFSIPPGKYVFRVKATNSRGVWAEKKINIIIQPPWWRTWWAYCIYGLLLFAMVFAAYRFQKRRIVLAERQRTQKRESEHAKEIEKAYTELKATQVQLIQSEKMASLGELTAGIAHEIQNPLNFVNNFSDVNKELLVEMKGEMNKGNLEEANTLLNDVIGNEQKINFHGKRADAIVKGMLQHSRKSTGIKELTDINLLADEYFRLSYHGMRAKDKTFNATMKSDFDPSIEKINIIPQDIGRVILNLINNAFYAVTEKKKQSGDAYEPTVSVSTKRLNGNVEVRVRDNGNGIPQKVLDKIFQPFFTTKPTGEGTGLGLSLAYDIVKAHGGEIKVETREREGSAFYISLFI
jgi:signal transduction histidine kinase/ligand-binding sensor domain-containing protein